MGKYRYIVTTEREYTIFADSIDEAAGYIARNMLGHSSVAVVDEVLELMDEDGQD